MLVKVNVVGPRSGEAYISRSKIVSVVFEEKTITPEGDPEVYTRESEFMYLQTAKCKMVAVILLEHSTRIRCEFDREVKLGDKSWRYASRSELQFAEREFEENRERYVEEALEVAEESVILYLSK